MPSPLSEAKRFSTPRLSQARSLSPFLAPIDTLGEPDAGDVPVPQRRETYVGR